MPSDGMSNAERLYNELCANKFAELMSKRPKFKPTPETCPYCGSANLTHHRVPLERTDMWVFCDDCGESWDK